MSLLDDIVDLIDQSNSDDRHEGNRYGQRDAALCERQPMLSGLFVTVVVALLVVVKDGVVDAVVGARLEEDVDEVGNDQEDGGAAGDVNCFGEELVRVGDFA